MSVSVDTCERRCLWSPQEGPWELDLLDSCETTGVVLGTEPGSSVRAARAPSPHVYVCMHATVLEGDQLCPSTMCTQGAERRS